ncbi:MULTISPECIES: hypothetical protein [unclassified Streptomyces]|uniref:hypothetical protein n=1 Tax=unclassified Streptomyces TaxID=2593676 RepID=UPI0029BBA6B4|nr:hypothetical protein [Streptomyces sp. DK15]MDX2389497.1 hypothetical protein [Streptomyces sp. DK15]
MSKLVEFFIAPDDVVAALVLRGGPGRALESVSCGNFDPEEAVIEWESFFTGRGFEELVDADEPRIVAGQDNDGSVVFAFSDRLVSALGAADEPRIGEVTGLWSQLRDEDGESLDVAVAGEILGDLARLARAAEGQGSGVYCWVA